MNILTIILSLATILGTIGTFYFGIKSLRLSREKITFSWQDTERGATYLLNKAEEKFKPQVVLMTGIEGAIITGIAMTKFPRVMPTYLVMLENKMERRFEPTVIPKDHELLSTSKWNIYIPNQVCKEHGKRILIIDDRIITGNIQRELRKFLENKGFKKENIMFAALVCASTAITTNNAPDLYYYKNPYEEFYFPYGSWT